MNLYKCRLLKKFLGSSVFPSALPDSSASSEVVAKHEGRLGLLTLNRPKALNSLNLGMIDAMAETYKEWDRDPNVRVVVLQSNDAKAFCAGGDVRAIHQAGKENTPLKKDFFVHEYQLNHLIHTLTRPHVALINGITMGGGAGISVHGHFVIATENTKFAMPEVNIGFAPDVGGSYFLSRLHRGYGMCTIEISLFSTFIHLILWSLY